jgi:hypothetical protein
MDHKLYPYQQQILKDIVSGGIKPGELMISLAGRQLGKSYINQYMMHWLPEAETPKYKVGSQALVDNKPWYTVHCSKDVANWVRQQPGEDKEWYHHISDKWTVYYDAFDIQEELYLMLVLKFGK